MNDKQITTEITKLPDGQSVQIVDEASTNRIHEKFPCAGKYVRIFPDGYFFPIEILPLLEKIQRFEFRASDVIVTTFPKSGTTWMQEIVWNLLYNPDGDNPEAMLNSHIRTPQIEGDHHYISENAPVAFEVPDNSPEILKNIARKAEELGHPRYFFFTNALTTKDPRVLKCHLSLSILPKSAIDIAKVVYVARDPRDVLVSRFHFLQVFELQRYQGTFDEHLDFFFNDEEFYNPYWKHIKSAWDLRNHPHVHIVYYEDLKDNTYEEIAKIDKFLGTNRTKQQIKQVVHFTSFEQMKLRNEKRSQAGFNLFHIYYNKELMKKTGGFFRKGKVGDWKATFTPEQKAKTEKWIKEFEHLFGPEFRYKV